MYQKNQTVRAYIGKAAKIAKVRSAGVRSSNNFFEKDFLRSRGVNRACSALNRRIKMGIHEGIKGTALKNEKVES